MQCAVVRSGIDLKLFEHLIEAGPKGMTLEELVYRTGADETLLREPFSYTLHC